jgi:transposase
VCKQGRPRALTPEASNGIFNFLSKYDKSAKLDEIQAFVKEKYDISVLRMAISDELRRQKLTRKKVFSSS